MNGVAKVTIKGQEYPLKFGVQSMFAYERVSKDKPEDLEEGSLALLASCNVLYSGMVGESLRSRTLSVKFEDVYDLFFDHLIFEKDFNDQISILWAVFTEANASLIPQKEEVADKKKAKNT